MNQPFFQNPQLAMEKERQTWEGRCSMIPYVAAATFDATKDEENLFTGAGIPGVQYGKSKELLMVTCNAPPTVMAQRPWAHTNLLGSRSDRSAFRKCRCCSREDLQ